MTSTLTSTPIIGFIQDYLAQHSGVINSISQLLGVPSAGIAGAVGQEASTVYFQDLDPIAGPVPFKSAIDSTLDGRVASFTSDEIAADFLARQADIQSGVAPSLLSKFSSPTSNDIGPANINLGQAILTLRSYLANDSYASDPLNLQQYANDYNKFAKDLIDPNSDTTFAITGLILKQGVADYTRVFGDQFTNASPQDQAAYLTTYFKQGSKYPNPTLNGDTSIGNPSSGDVLPLPPASSGDGGPFVISNFGVIQNILSGGQTSNTPLANPGAEIQIQNASVDSNGFSALLANWGLNVRINADGTGSFQTQAGVSVNFGPDATLGFGTDGAGAPALTFVPGTSSVGLESDGNTLANVGTGGRITVEQNGGINIANVNQGDIQLDQATYDQLGNLIDRNISTLEGLNFNETFTNGVGTNVTETDANGNTRSLSVADLGQSLGSSIGSILGGNSLEGKIAASTVIGLIGKNFGSLLQQSGNWTQDVTAENADGVSVLARRAD